MIWRFLAIAYSMLISLFSPARLATIVKRPMNRMCSFHLLRLYLRGPAVVPVVHEQALGIVWRLLLQVLFADFLQVPGRRRVRLRRHLDENLSKPLTHLENHGLEESWHAQWLRAQGHVHATPREEHVGEVAIDLWSMARDLCAFFVI